MGAYKLTEAQLDKLKVILEMTETAVRIDSTLLGYGSQETFQTDRAWVKHKLGNTAPEAVPHDLLVTMLGCVFKVEAFGTNGVQLSKPFQYYRSVEELLAAT